MKILHKIFNYFLILSNLTYGNCIYQPVIQNFRDPFCLLSNRKCLFPDLLEFLFYQENEMVYLSLIYYLSISFIPFCYLGIHLIVHQIIKKCLDILFWQGKHLLVILSIIIIPQINVLLFRYWLVHLLTILRPKLLYNLVTELRPFLYKNQESFLSYCLSKQLSFCPINELKSFVITNLVATNN